MVWSGRFDDMILKGDDPGSALNVRNHYQKVPLETNSKASSVIQNLQPGFTVNLVGVILRKESPRSVITKKNPSKERYCMAFTIRDSVDWFINATCWGDKSTVCYLSECFRIGEVVEVNNAMVMAASSYDEKFKPWSPSPLCLNISESGSIAVHTGPERDRYLSYNHLPTKPYSDYYTLEDVNINGQALHGEHVNLLVAVRRVNEVKNITTKTGKRMKQCEVRLFDETCPIFTLTLWEEQLINDALLWVPNQTVLFINDVKVTFDDFRNYMVSTATSRTVITVNPDIEEAQHLYQYAQNNPDSTGMVEYVEDSPDISTITDVYTVKDINDSMTNPSPTDQYGLCYSFISWFDVDSDNRSYIQLHCPDCMTPLNTDSPMCLNTNCVSTYQDMKSPVTKFHITIAISDYTDTLRRCYLSNDIAENLLNISANQFPLLSENNKTQLKWKVLFERFKIYFKIKRQPQISRQIQRMKILHCMPICLQELSVHYQQKTTT